MFAPPDATSLVEQANATFDTIANLNEEDGMQAAAEATAFARLLAEQMFVRGTQRYRVSFRAKYDEVMARLRAEAGL